MKYLYLALFTVLLISCKKNYEVKCINRPYIWLFLTNRDTTAVYSSYTYTAYKQGTNFSVVAWNADTFSTYPYYKVRVADTAFSDSFARYDWVVRLLPDNTEVRIRGLQYTQHSEKFQDYQVTSGYKCINAYSLYINDSFYNIPSQHFDNSNPYYEYIYYSF